MWQGKESQWHCNFWVLFLQFTVYWKIRAAIVHNINQNNSRKWHNISVPHFEEKKELNVIRSFSKRNNSSPYIIGLNIFEK